MSDPCVSMRLAQSRDALDIARLSRDQIESGLGWRYDAPRIMRCMADPDIVVLVACDGLRLAGFAIMHFGEEHAHLMLLAVRPSHRRRGIARGLVNWLLESALTAGIGAIHLEMRAGNQAAKRFYSALAFSETALVPGYYDGREAAQCMRRVLRQPIRDMPLIWRPS